MSSKIVIDEEKALEGALNLFWARGFDATSTEQLAEAMGVESQNLRQLHGDKRSIFLAAIERYRQTIMAPMLHSLEAEDAGLDTIRGIFRGLVEIFSGDDASPGCFLVNSTMELAYRDDVVAHHVQDHLERLENGFAGVLEKAIANGELTSTRGARPIARHLTTLVQGLTVVTKAERSRGFLEDSVEVALSLLD